MKQVLCSLPAQGSMWQRPLARPRPRSAIKMASVWFRTYCPAIVTQENESIICTLVDDNLWSAFEQIEIDGLHTGRLNLLEVLTAGVTHINH
ncbi:hypothetical protein M1512_03220 [Patescibacteria group bacterium]|nr:hypothetical protein [Patescibacteria group bacterium]